MSSRYSFSLRVQVVCLAVVEPVDLIATRRRASTTHFNTRLSVSKARQSFEGHLDVDRHKVVVRRLVTIEQLVWLKFAPVLRAATKRRALGEDARADSRLPGERTCETAQYFAHLAPGGSSCGFGTCTTSSPVSSETRGPLVRSPRADEMVNGCHSSCEMYGQLR